MYSNSLSWTRVVVAGEKIAYFYPVYGSAMFHRYRAGNFSDVSCKRESEFFFVSFLFYPLIKIYIAFLSNVLFHLNFNRVRSIAPTHNADQHFRALPYRAINPSYRYPSVLLWQFVCSNRPAINNRRNNVRLGVALHGSYG